MDYEPEQGARRPRMADWAKLAAERLAQLQADGEKPQPVQEKSRALAKNFWGKAWMRQLAWCEQNGLGLAPGRSLLRHGCVLNLELSAGHIKALVSAEELYEVELKLAPPPEEHLEQLRARCSGAINSLLALLEGRVDSDVLAELCEPEAGLLPLPHEWQMSCTCPDWSEPCPHVAAAIYAAGCKIDADATLLFQLRQVPTDSLLTLPKAQASDFDQEQLSSLFGVNIDLT